MTVARVLLPKEHGAYGQVALPLATAFAVAGFSRAGLLLSVAVLAGFLAHEPAALVLGLRGARARRESWPRAARFLGACLVGGCAAAVAGAIAAGSDLRWSLLIPAVPVAVLTIAMVTGQEKSWYGEIAAAFAFAGVSVPVVLAAGASLLVAVSVAIPFALLFASSTLAVRVVIVRVRGGGDPYAATLTRRATLAVAGVSTLLIGALAVVGRLPTPVLIASVPGLATAAIVAVRPPAANRLRALGWRLVAVSILTALIIVATV